MTPSRPDNPHGVLAYHVIFSTYGFWLPNDPRGSWSDFVGAWELFRFGPATKTDQRRSLAHEAHDHHKRLAAKAALKYPPVEFTGRQARAVGQGFEAFVRKSGLTVWACSILPTHVHIVVRRHRYRVEYVVNQLKGAATRRLIEAELHPLAACAASGRPPKAWARGEWKVFLNDAVAIRRAVRYVADNPLKEGLRRQQWQFVTPLDV
jgi:REP element-mobilizing transposase RayT